MELALFDFADRLRVRPSRVCVGLSVVPACECLRSLSPACFFFSFFSRFSLFFFSRYSFSNSSLPLEGVRSLNSVTLGECFVYRSRSFVLFFLSRVGVDASSSPDDEPKDVLLSFSFPLGPLLLAVRGDGISVLGDLEPESLNLGVSDRSENSGRMGDLCPSPAFSDRPLVFFMKPLLVSRRNCHSRFVSVRVTPEFATSGK